MSAPPEPADKPPLELGRPQNGRPFDVERRRTFLDWIAKGASLRQASVLTRVARATVRDWLKRGRSDEGRPEAKAFAEAFEEARALGVGELLVDLKTHSKTDHRATVALLAALDDRFGAAERRLKIEALQLENERLRLERDKAAFEARLVDLKAAALDRLLAIPGATESVGMRALGSDDNITPDVHELLEALARLLGRARAQLIAKGWEADDDETDQGARDIVGRLMTEPGLAERAATPAQPS
ncbi:MAG: hypothetical protein IT385_02715 [Deltaproteobacteria bacterium]|nr:hypothetical protein [Deltaproteobacteria bacterium]